MVRAIKTLLLINSVLAIAILLAIILLGITSKADPAHSRQSAFMSPTLHSKNKIKVMIIDTGVDWQHPDIKPFLPQMYQRTFFPTIDSMGHGTHVAGIITRGACDELEIIPCRWYLEHDSVENNMARSNHCFFDAYIHGDFDIINYSASDVKINDHEVSIIRELYTQKTIVVAALGNGGIDIDITKMPTYPACYQHLSNIRPVANLTRKLKREPESNWRSKTPVIWEIGTDIWSAKPGGGGKYVYTQMSGTSMAAAVHTNKLVKQLCRDLREKSN